MSSERIKIKRMLPVMIRIQMMKKEDGSRSGKVVKSFGCKLHLNKYITKLRTFGGRFG